MVFIGTRLRLALLGGVGVLGVVTATFGLVVAGTTALAAIGCAGLWARAAARRRRAWRDFSAVVRRAQVEGFKDHLQAALGWAPTAAGRAAGQPAAGD